MRFLVVDDDELSRELVTLLLEVEGYAVDSASSGEEALARLAKLQTESAPLPDVVLADVQLPGLAGKALAQALRASLAGETLLLAMSGSQPQEEEIASFDGFLLKPFAVRELRGLVESSSSATKLVASEPRAVTDNVDDEDDAAVLDEDIYTKLCDLMPPVQLVQMYALCNADARSRIANMRALAVAGDDSGYRHEAHAIKGGCGMIGAAELHSLAGAAERDGLVSHTSPELGTTSVIALVQRLELACNRLERILMERTRV